MPQTMKSDKQKPLRDKIEKEGLKKKKDIKKDPRGRLRCPPELSKHGC